MEQETQGTRAASLADRDHRTELLPMQRGRGEHHTGNHQILLTLTGDNTDHCKQQVEIRVSGSQEIKCFMLEISTE